MLTTVWQLAPVYPGAQEHVYVLMPSLHVPPFWHGLGAQSLMLVPQVVPVNPATHEHV